MAEAQKTTKKPTVHTVKVKGFDIKVKDPVTPAALSALIRVILQGIDGLLIHHGATTAKPPRPLPKGARAPSELGPFLLERLTSNPKQASAFVHFLTKLHTSVASDVNGLSTKSSRRKEKAKAKAKANLEVKQTNVPAHKQMVQQILQLESNSHLMESMSMGVMSARKTAIDTAVSSYITNLTPSKLLKVCKEARKLYKESPPLALNTKQKVNTFLSYNSLHEIPLYLQLDVSHTLLAVELEKAISKEPDQI